MPLQVETLPKVEIKPNAIRKVSFSDGVMVGNMGRVVSTINTENLKQSGIRQCAMELLGWPDEPHTLRVVADGIETLIPWNKCAWAIR